MTKRCKHQYEIKPGYPDELLCPICQTCWNITDFLSYNTVQLMTLPKGVRYAVVKRQAEEFQRKNPDYYKEVNL